MNQLLEDIQTLQNLLISKATGGAADVDEYKRIRKQLIAIPDLQAHVPSWIRTSRDLDQFWAFIKSEREKYKERRELIYRAFGPLLDAIERGVSPAQTAVSEALEKFDAANVQAAWSKALQRRTDDPEGAITVARTLLESVLKHILDDMAIVYDDAADLNRLYRLASESLGIAPSQHTEDVFRQILGGCASVVGGLGALRNRLSDAHGKGKAAVRPAPRHAELAVNLAGAMAVFLMATWETRAA